MDTEDVRLNSIALSRLLNINKFTIRPYNQTTELKKPYINNYCFIRITQLRTYIILILLVYLKSFYNADYKIISNSLSAVTLFVFTNNIIILLSLNINITRCDSCY